MSVLPVTIPSVGRWSLAPRTAPRTRIAAPAGDALGSSSTVDLSETEEWMRLPMPMPLFVASTAVGSIAMIMSGVGFLVLR